MNVAVVGLGIGADHVSRFAAVHGVAVVAAADLEGSRLLGIARDFGIRHTASDYREIVERPDVDAVAVCLPNHLHAAVSAEFLEAGKHVLVEKPMAMTATEAQRMAETAHRCGRVLAVAMNYRWIFGPDSLYLKQLICDGALGRIYYIRAQSLRRSTGSGEAASWRTARTLSGGGALIDMGVHKLDLAMWFLDDFSPRAATATTATELTLNSDVDDFCVGMIRMGSGAVMTLESTLASHTRGGGIITLMGTQGGAVLDLSMPAGKRLSLFGRQGHALTEWTPTEIDVSAFPDRSVQEHFVRCIRQGIVPETSAERGVAMMRLVDAMYRSSEEQREITLEPAVPAEAPT